MSLVETMMGSVVMTFVFAGVFSGLAQANMMANRARNQHFANQILKLETQHLKTLGWDDIASNNTSLTSVTGSGSSAKTWGTGGVGDSSSAKYFVSTIRGFYDDEIPMADLQLVADVGAVSNNQREITLTLKWKEINGRNVERTVSVTLSEFGATDSYVPVF